MADLRQGDAAHEVGPVCPQGTMLRLATQTVGRREVGREVDSLADPIVLEGVSRWYGPVIGLNDVSLRIARGVTGLLGPNGAGKSTLIRLVTGQIAPSLGTVRVLGADVFRDPRALARVGCCPDIERFNEDWTGLGFVEAAAWLCGLSKKAARARALELLELVALSDAARSPLASYSKGMRQRAKLAQALVNDPEVLVLDEPLTGMDPVVRKGLVELVRRLGAEGRTVLVSSHVLHEVEAMTEEVVLMHHGRVLAEGRIHEIRALLSGHPHHVTIESADPRALARHVLEHADVVGMRFEGRAVTIETQSVEPLFRAVESLVLDGGHAVERMYTRDDSLAAVFDYLVK